MKIIFTLALILPFKAYTQLAFGVNTGIIFNNYVQTDLSGFSDTKVISKIGAQLSITGQYQINRFILSTGLGWIQKNYTIQRTGEYAGLFQAFTNNYLEVPLTIGKVVVTFKKCSLLINAGGFGGWWAKGSINGNLLNILNLQNKNGSYTFSIESFRDNYVFDKHKDKRFELGATANAMLACHLWSNIQLYVKCFYDYSLTDQQKEQIANTPQKRNQLIGLSIGTNFNL